VRRRERTNEKDSSQSVDSVRIDAQGNEMLLYWGSLPQEWAKRRRLFPLKEGNL